MRSVLVPAFYLWLACSIGVLINRRLNHGSFRSPAADDTAVTAPTEPFPTPPPVAPADVVDTPPSPDGADATVGAEPAGDDTVPSDAVPSDAKVAVKPAPVTTSGPASETLADALGGITMPCELMPLVTDRFEPRIAAFSTQGFDAAAVGTAVADEFEGLGYELTPIDSRTIDARRGADHVQIRLTSAALDSAAVMEARFPSANPDALVVEFRLV